MKKILLCGDAEGSFDRLFQTVDMQQKKVGFTFDALFCIGAFFPPKGDASAEMMEYLSGRKEPPVDTYFIDTQSAPLIGCGRKDFSDKLHFLGSHGVKDVHGLKIAFLSGLRDESNFEQQEEAGAGPFVNSNYTRGAIDEMKKQAKEVGACDILLAGEWPTGWQDKISNSSEKLHAAERPSMNSPAVAELVAALEPRYAICASNNLFYQRPPFQTLTKGHVCRFIALGKVGAAGKERKWLHALQIVPISEMDEEVLMEQPENTTPSPFAAIVGDKEAKKAAAKVECETEEVYLANLPHKITEKVLVKALKKIGELKRLRLAKDKDDDDEESCAGYGWATFASIEDAKAAVALSGSLECGGRKIRLSFNKSKRSRQDASDDFTNRKRRRVGPNIVVEPHSECWFCLANPKVQQHLILSCISPVYITLAKGGLTEDHVLILPVKHAPSYAACPPDIQIAIDHCIHALRLMFRDKGKEIIVYERWIPMRMAQANHMQIQVIPVPSSLGSHAHSVLEIVTEKHLKSTPIRKIDGPHEIADLLQGDPKAAYCYFEFPGDLTAGGRRLEKFVIRAPGMPIPINFPREVVAQLLEMPHRIDWRDCQLEGEVESALAAKLRNEFKPYVPKLPKQD